MYLGGNRRWVPLTNAKDLAKVSNKQPRRSRPSRFFLLLQEEERPSWFTIHKTFPENPVGK